MINTKRATRESLIRSFDHSNIHSLFVIRISSFGLALLLAILIARPAAAQQTSALINQALDSQLKWSAKDMPLPQAMKEIANKTGVRIEATAQVYDLLPWGDQTTISAQVDNQTLRAALEAMTRKLGLTFVLKDNYVELRPMPALARLGRRANLPELRALDLLASTPINLPSEQVKVSQLIEAIDSKLVELKSPFAIENRIGERVGADRVISVPRNATIMDALEALTAQTAGTWYPWEKSIVVLPKEEQIRNLLNKTVSVRYEGVDVTQVLSDLSQRSGVDFIYEPGAIQRVPTQYRTIPKLVLIDVPIKQALESLAAFTGLGYVANEGGVYIWNATYGYGAGGGSSDPVVATMQLDNGMTVMMRSSVVPDDIRQYIQFKQKREFDKLRQQMKEESFKPATRPTTAPANPDL